MNAYEASYLPETSTQVYLYGARAKSESGNAILKMRFNKARVAVRASQKVINEDAMGNITANEDGSLTYTLALARRWSIYFLYEHVLGSPPEDKWAGRSGTITSIRRILGIPLGSNGCVRKVLSDVCAADTAVVEYDPTADMAHGGVPKIVEGTEQARIVSDAMASGVGIGQAAVLVNVFRARLNATLGEIDPDAPELKPISWSAVRGFVERSPSFELHKRGTKKSGKNDEGTHTLVPVYQRSLI